MDIAKTKFKHQCQKHPDFLVEFLQVDNLNVNKKEQKIFYCSNCVDEDSTFNNSNYQLIKPIIKHGRDQILSKWPPVNENGLLQQLIELSTGNDQVQQIIAEIEQYFTGLKQDILGQIDIDICQNQMIQQAQELALNKAEILYQYQELSKVNDLRSILVDNQTDIHQKEKNYREILDNILLKKQDIKDQLASLLNQHNNTKLTTFNSESAHQIKQSILNSIKNINFFDFQNISTQNNNSNQIPIDLQFLTTYNNNGNISTQISKNNNNQYEIIVKQYNFSNIVSGIILQNKMKYVFRIEIQMLENNECCYIGLMQNSQINNYNGYKDNLSCYLKQQENNLYLMTDNLNGISKVIKGNDFVLKENQIEMRVCIEDQIFEILDYPNYHFKLILADEYQSNLINHKDLIFYFRIYGQNNRVIIKNAFTVNKFE